MQDNLFTSELSAGTNRIGSFRARLRIEGKPEESKQQTFKLGPVEVISASESYKLLSGRSIQKEYATISGQKQDAWVQLDFNDKDPVGNYRMKEFHSGFDKELQKVVNGLPLKDMIEMEKNKLLESLSNGDRPHVTHLREGKEQTFYIEATPQLKSISIYDDHSKKVSVASAMGMKTPDPVQAVKRTNLQRDLGNNRKNGLSMH